MFKNVTVGADIEVFLQDRGTQEVVSAEGHILGSKYMPHQYDEENPNYNVSLDNVLAEFGIPPAKSADEFVMAIAKSLAYINSTIPGELCTVSAPAARLAQHWLETPNAQEFGCEPDYNAYSRMKNERPCALDKNLRSAGGHIHIGWEDAPAYNEYIYKGDDIRCNLIKTLDAFLGLPSVLLEPENERKQLYGKAGAFRPKWYGVEYRTISNFYAGNESLTRLVYQNTMEALDFINAGNIIDERLSLHIQETINKNNKEAAKMAVENLGIKLAA